MAPAQSSESAETIASSIATALAEAAACLSRVGSLSEFTAAVAAHRRAWQRLSASRPALRAEIPERIIQFSLAVPARSRLDDDQVEALICWDDFAAHAVAQAVEHGV